MKYIVLEILKGLAPEYVSGEKLSAQLGVSRTMVWKHITELRNEGYNIKSVTNKGYRLVPGADILNSYEIQSGFTSQNVWKDIRFYKSVDSTSNVAKKVAAEETGDRIVILADHQTGGRGRLGRTWDSMQGKGIWMSVIVRPKIVPAKAQIITLAAGIAVVRAIRHTTGIKAGIKWPNDIIIEGRKVCGILTEMSAEMECVNYIILGIGLNVAQNREDFPEEIRDTAGSLKMFTENDKTPSRSTLVRSTLAELETQYERVNSHKTSEIINEWRKYSITLGREVKVVSTNGNYFGRALDITSSGSLIIVRDDGTQIEVSSGAVSVRGIAGYV